jgi:transposase
MHAYSLDLRQRIVAALDAGKRPSEVAVLFSVGVSTVKRYRQQRRETGALDPRSSPGRTPTIRPEQREILWAQLVEHPVAILEEHCALWAAATGVRVSITTMSREIRRLGWTRKKGRWVPPSGTRSTVPSGIGL